VTITHYCESITLYALAVIEEKIQEEFGKGVLVYTRDFFSLPVGDALLGRSSTSPKAAA
jgi:hypothetical protein